MIKNDGGFTAEDTEERGGDDDDDQDDDFYHKGTKARRRNDASKTRIYRENTRDGGRDGRFLPQGRGHLLKRRVKNGAVF